MSKFDTHGGYFAPQDSMRINEGGSHEENPNGGVQIGVDEQGIPNMLEEGEPVYKDYVYSDNIKADKKFLEANGIPAKYAGMLYSDIADSLFSEAEDRPYDPISRNGLEAMLGRLANAQEQQKEDMERRKLERELRNLSPEELQYLERELMASQEQRAQQEMMQQQIPDDAAQSEIAAEDVQVEQEGMMPMAYGGYLNRFEDGGPKSGGRVGYIDVDAARQAALEAGPDVENPNMLLLPDWIAGVGTRGIKTAAQAEKYIMEHYGGRTLAELKKSVDGLKKVWEEAEALVKSKGAGQIVVESIGSLKNRAKLAKQEYEKAKQGVKIGEDLMSKINTIKQEAASGKEVLKKGRKIAKGNTMEGVTKRKIGGKDLIIGSAAAAGLRYGAPFISDVARTYHDYGTTDILDPPDSTYYSPADTTYVDTGEYMDFANGGYLRRFDRGGNTSGEIEPAVVVAERKKKKSQPNIMLDPRLLYASSMREKVENREPQYPYYQEYDYPYYMDRDSQLIDDIETIRQYDGDDESIESLARAYDNMEKTNAVINDIINSTSYANGGIVNKFDGRSRYSGAISRDEDIRNAMRNYLVSRFWSSRDDEDMPTYNFGYNPYGYTGDMEALANANDTAGWVLARANAGLIDEDQYLARVNESKNANGFLNYLAQNGIGYNDIANLSEQDIANLYYDYSSSLVGEQNLAKQYQNYVDYDSEQQLYNQYRQQGGQGEIYSNDFATYLMKNSPDLYSRIHPYESVDRSVMPDVTIPWENTGRRYVTPPDLSYYYSMPNPDAEMVEESLPQYNGWNSFIDQLNNYKVSRNPGNISGKYRIDNRFPLAGHNTIKELEDSEAYKAFTDYVLNNPNNADVLRYLHALDNGTASGVEKLFNVEKKLKDNWKDLYRNRRYDQKGGIYHFSGDNEIFNPATAVIAGDNPAPKSGQDGLVRKTPYKYPDFWNVDVNSYLHAPTQNELDAQMVEESLEDGNGGNGDKERYMGPLFPTFPRFAGAIGAGALGLYNALQRPDKYTATRIQPYVPTGHINLHNVRYMPVDQNMIQNQMLAQGNSTQRALGNSGLGPSTAAAILAADNNITGNLGTGFLQSWQANNQQRNAVIAANNQAEAQRAQFDYGVDAAKQRALTAAQMANAQNNLLIQRLNYQAETDKYNAMSNQINAGLEALAGIGRENFARNQINTNTALEGEKALGAGVGAYNPYGLYGYPYGQRLASCGGKIKKSKK